MSAETSSAINEVPALLVQHAVPCRHPTALSYPLDAQWVVAPVDGSSPVQWRVYKLQHNITEDDMEWVPLQGIFESPEEGRRAVKVYLERIAPVFLDENGNPTTKYARLA